jgi:hypothetical protein
LALLGVWLFAGIWHGTGWNYICYGLYYFFFIVMERQIEDAQKKRRKRLKIKKKPMTLFQKIGAHCYFFVVLIFGQLLFRSKDLHGFHEYFKSMFWLSNNNFGDARTYYYWIQCVALLFIGWIFAFPVVDLIKHKCTEKKCDWVLSVVSPIAYGAILVLAIAYAMTNTYQSFVYFQF